MGFAEPIGNFYLIASFYEIVFDRGFSMLGAIAGDIIGSVYEGQPIKTTHFPLFSPGSTYTDDSVLTVAIADAILNNIEYLKSFIKWFNFVEDIIEDKQEHNEEKKTIFSNYSYVKFCEKSRYFEITNSYS